MTNDERLEIVNAARSYERIVAERQTYLRESLAAIRDNRHDKAREWRGKFDDSKNRAGTAERLLAERIYAEHDFVRVDDVIYMAYSTETLMRIPLGLVPDLASDLGWEHLLTPDVDAAETD